MWDKVKTYPEHFWLGVGLIAIGVWLITNDRFFMWPPYAVDFLTMTCLAVFSWQMDWDCYFGFWKGVFRLSGTGASLQ